MMPVAQQRIHMPGRGQYGDCHRAVMASLFEIPISDVPYFNEDGPGADRFDARVSAWLAERNLSSVTFPLQGSIQSVLEGVAKCCPSAFWMLSGTSRGGLDHMVICRGAEVVHDPAPAIKGLAGPCTNGFYWATFLVPIDPSFCTPRLGWRGPRPIPWWKLILGFKS